MSRKNVNFEYYRKSVYYDHDLPDCPYGSCGYSINDNGEYILTSYITNVCGYNPKENKIWCIGTFSATTRKHIGAFAKLINSRFGTHFTYYDFKRAAIEYENDTTEDIPIYIN